MLHSRVADLRKEGHLIECWRDGEDYLYRMVRETQVDGEPGQPASPGPSAAVAVPPIEAGQAGPADLPLEPARQLDLWSAAA
jgi:hypothetical protein